MSATRTVACTRSCSKPEDYEGPNLEELLNINKNKNKADRKVQNYRHVQHTDTHVNRNIIDNISLKHKTEQNTTHQHAHKRREHKATFNPR